MSTEKTVNDADDSSLISHVHHNHHLSDDNKTPRPDMPEPNCSDDYHPCVIIRTDRSQLHGVSILCLSDTHDFQKGMPVKNKLPRADILVHSGDFTTRGTAEEVANFQAWMQELLATGVVNHVVVIAGNHELTFEPWKAKHPAVRARQEQVKESLISVPACTTWKIAALSCAVFVFMVRLGRFQLQGKWTGRFRCAKLIWQRNGRLFRQLMF